MFGELISGLLENEAVKDFVVRKTAKGLLKVSEKAISAACSRLSSSDRTTATCVEEDVPAPKVNEAHERKCAQAFQVEAPGRENDFGKALDELVACQNDLRRSIREGTEKEVLEVRDRIDSLRCKVGDNKVLNSLSKAANRRVAAFDKERRMVGGCLCSSVAEAIRSKAARPKVDELVARHCVISPQTLVTLAQDLTDACFETEYGRLGLARIRERAKKFAELRTEEVFGSSSTSEDSIKQYREELTSLCMSLGAEPFSGLLKQANDKLTKIDCKARTVNGRVCATREEAELLRKEIPIVDSIVRDQPEYPLGNVDRLLNELRAANLESEYARKAIRKLEKRRKYMLTVDGVAYSSQEEAEQAFQSACGAVGKFLAYQVAYGNKRGARAILAAKHWPGSLPPDSVMAKFNSGDLSGAARRLGAVAIPGLVESYSDTVKSIVGVFKKKSKEE